MRLHGAEFRESLREEGLPGETNGRLQLMNLCFALWMVTGAAGWIHPQGSCDHFHKSNQQGGNPHPRQWVCMWLAYVASGTAAQLFRKTCQEEGERWLGI